MRRTAVAVVVAATVALGGGAGTVAWTDRQRQSADARLSAAVARVEDARVAVVDDHAGRGASAADADAAHATALLGGARAALAAAVERARQTLDASAGQVGDDDAPRAALADRLDAAVVAGPAASPARARGLAAEVAAAEQGVLDAVAAQRARAEEQEVAARAAARRAAAAAGTSPPGASAPGAGTSRDRCTTTYSGPAFYTSTPTDGGDGSNGRLPASALAAVSWTADSRGTPFYLRSDAAAALERLNTAFRGALGHDLALDLTYRDLDTQVAMREALGTVAAVPGTSSHGTGLAIDVPELPCDYGWDSAARAWLVAYGPAYGWVSPGWARQGGSNPEYWHYEYRG
ncbi:D-alanyl-D-alanine carboxypeptidase family protein [Cellulomonas sp. B6]|uniref:M15 family metallopeptidase n=1 Tax=Cellulomonas sp. B6 TaxID=1295626 RepID=UPI00073BD92E|nr:M15 family metallopeptidase [Cellulomonas sp. B6]KSW29374.1 peptidase M15 [Cellulomonas sp. B6]